METSPEAKNTPLCTNRNKLPTAQTKQIEILVHSQDRLLGFIENNARATPYQILFVRQIITFAALRKQKDTEKRSITKGYCREQGRHILVAALLFSGQEVTFPKTSIP